MATTKIAEHVANALAGVAEMASQLSESATHHVGPLETRHEASDRVDSRLAQAHAMLYMTVAGVDDEGENTFSRMNSTMRREYLQAVSDLISAARVDSYLAIANARERGVEAERYRLARAAS